jgi:hypothetical protein
LIFPAYGGSAAATTQLVGIVHFDHRGEPVSLAEANLVAGDEVHFIVTPRGLVCVIGSISDEQILCRFLTARFGVESRWSTGLTDGD